jgi:branched-chain amino acid transport system substrate-binding protein
MEKQAQKLGIKILLKEKYEKGSTDFKPLLARVKAVRPDVIYMVSYAVDAALLVKQIRELRVNAKLYAGGAAGFALPEFIVNAKNASEYVVTATLWSPKLKFPGAMEFAEKFKTRHGEYPSYHGASAYSSLFVIKDALERAKRWKPEDIREALANTNVTTPFGTVQFLDMEGYQNQNFMHTLVLQVLNGEHETIWPLAYATKKYVYPLPTGKERK